MKEIKSNGFEEIIAQALEEMKSYKEIVSLWGKLILQI